MVLYCSKNDSTRITIREVREVDWTKNPLQIRLNSWSLDCSKDEAPLRLQSNSSWANIPRQLASARLADTKITGGRKESYAHPPEWPSWSEKEMKPLWSRIEQDSTSREMDLIGRRSDGNPLDQSPRSIQNSSVKNLKGSDPSSAASGRSNSKSLPILQLGEK